MNKNIEMTPADRLQLLKSFLEEDPGDPFNHYALALEHLRRGDRDAAAEMFKHVSTAFPDYVATYYPAGKLHEEMLEFDMATEYYQKGIEAAKKSGNTKTEGELKNALEMMIFENDL